MKLARGKESLTLPNHQYDTDDFFTALDNGILPSVTFLKAPSFQDAHPGNSDPTDEQTFVVNVINALQESTFWESTAVVITYDDSDGWYDHQMPSIVNPSTSLTVDALNSAWRLQDRRAAGDEDGKLPKDKNRRSMQRRRACLCWGAAATARAFRCSSSRPGRAITTSTTPNSTRPRSSASSKTTGSTASLDSARRLV